MSSPVTEKICPARIAAVEQRAERIHSADEVAAAIDRMAREITAELADSDPVLLCVMNGGLLVSGQLALRLAFPLQIDYLHLSRYRDATRGGRLEFLAQPRLALQERQVLVVDDIFDEGHTLAAVLCHCREKGAARVWSAVLVDKQRPRQRKRDANLPRPDFIGLQVPDRYVFGYGMDYKGYLRNVNGIYAVAEADEDKN